MKEILRKIESVYNDICQKEADAERILTGAQAIADSIKDREARVIAIESAQTVLDAANVVLAKAEQMKNELAEERVQFENFVRVEKQKLADEATRLLPLKDAEKQLFTDRQNLYAAQAALEKEKAEYRERIEKEVKAHFANTDGR